jgi:4-diphosphocytidyl-2-C-methyl-D-erythritol kinase
MSLTALLDVPAPAKINLFLHVVGRRADGYHLLQSVFLLIDWADTLHFERRNNGRLSREDLGPALPEDDLSLRAARALQAASGSSMGVHIRTEKRVPWGAGLGGGSSDAASTLLALNRLWGLNWPRSALQRIALTLGADVPFFIGGHNAWVEGIGEKLTPINLPPMHLAVLKPAIAIPTAAIFGSHLLRRDTPVHIISDFLADTQSPKLAQFGRNDLQPSALAFCQAHGPQDRHGSGSTGSRPDPLSEALSLMAHRFGSSRMSGSGSAVFAVLPDVDEKTASAEADDPRDLRRLLATVPENAVGRICHSLSEHPLVGWASD